MTRIPVVTRIISMHCNRTKDNYFMHFFHLYAMTHNDIEKI